MSYQASKDADGYWVAAPGAMLQTSQRIENKIKRKLGRGETLSGPFAAHPAGQASVAALQSAQDAKIKALEEKVNQLLIAAGKMPPPAKA